ncbi:MAG TPA: right-handed parallel beta-helix repeat-containing protein, partial [Lacipirellulaceae bacterium]|nr:right-handed parallel beta-helix repeat-containing protein [Lacipirellulaceae bacterium]
MSRQLRHQWLSPFLNPSRSKTSRSAAGSSPYRRRLRLERLEERQLLATFTVTNTFDSGLGSLRHLIIAANLSPNTDIDGDGIPEPDRIAFHIPASDPGHVYYREDGVAGQVTLSNVTATTAVNDGAIPNIDPDWPHSWYSIKPASELPTITSRVVMDGYTQPGARANTLAVGKNTVLKVEIDGSSGPVDAVGLHIDSDGGSTVSGLVINRFTRSNNTNPGGHGIQLGGIGGNVVEGNFLGTDISGTTPQGNTRAGVEINSPANLIGGTTPQARNVISGNLQVGISITGVHAIRNIVQGNFIGVDATGTRALGNEFGVFCFSDENIIGGTIAGGRNVISGNDADGIRILGSHNVLQGNFIGTDFTGNVALGNGRGVHVHFGTDNTVGGLSPAARNVISGNIESGIDVERPRIDETPSFSFAQNTLIQGNFIGTTASGAAPLGNGAFGILVTSSSNLIGAASGAGGNVISANGRGGIFFWGLSAQDNIVQGNLIGGTTALGNQDFGIKIQAGIHNKVGGEEHGAGNTIAFNVTDGVQVSLDDAKRNAVVGNQIFSNGMVGINLGDRVTPNDPDDSDDGPNNFQNFPEIRHA